MKRTATLLAGLLLVTGTVFAAEWTVTGARVETNTTLVDTQNGVGGVNGGDLDLEVKAEKTGAYGTVGLVLQNDIDDDTDLRITYSKTEGDWTVATEALLIDADGKLLGETSDTTTTGKNGNMNKGDGTYISWDVMGSKMFKLTYYPYEVGGLSFDNETFESFIGYANPGMKLDVKVNDKTNVAFRLATDNGMNNTENLYSYKVDVETKVGSAEIKAAAGVGEVTNTYVVGDSFLDVVSVATGQAGTYTKEGSFVAAQLKMPIAKFTVLAEANMETAEFSQAGVKVGEIDATAVYLKGSYAMGTYNKYSVTPYASVEITDTEVKIGGVKSPTKSDTVTDLEAGVELNQGSFTITPKVVVNKADDNKSYLKEDGDANSNKKTATAVGVKFAYSM